MTNAKYYSQSFTVFEDQFHYPVPEIKWIPLNTQPASTKCVIVPTILVPLLGINLN